MFARRKLAKRFNLLLLEDSENYVADWVASCKWPSNVEGNWQGLGSLPGRLRLCTKSLFFEPDDVRVPIVRLDFASIVQLEADNLQSLIVGASKVTKMKPNCADVPYVVERNIQSTWVFTLTYAKLDSFMPLAQEQLVVSRLPAAERLELLDAAVKVREDAASFDTSRLVEYSERVVWEGPAVQLSPLVREPGRLAVTDHRLYFQPLHNITGDTPVRTHPLAAVVAVVRRRSCLVPVGLELFMFNPTAQESRHLQPGLQQCGGPYWDAPSAFFTFRSEVERDKALAAITEQPALGIAVSQLVPRNSSSSSSNAAHSAAVAAPPAGQQHSPSQVVDVGQLLEASGGWLQRVMLAWQRGNISNFDYLLYLNLAAGRSFNDLAQWPVFPWVLKDYTSAELDLNSSHVFRDLTKPVGAQTQARLEVFRERYKEMDAIMQHEDAAGHMPEPFMYGTHYSTPGYVMYWLVRAAPGHMLRLQAGKFDAPDRLFNSLADSWHSATTSTTDVKELIPEFYMPGGDFLVNGSQLALGIRQNGVPVNDVVLPPWAATPDELLAVHRAALEAPYVSANLHHWIDLIFGYKQRGPAAVEADNVFYHLTYEGAVDITKVTSLQELKALETQINEFGQTPKQLFTHAHPPRLVQPPAPDPSTVFTTGTSNIGTDNYRFNASAASLAAGPAGASTAALPPGQVVVSSSTSKARLKGGGEDAAGGAICFALVSTVLAAAAPDIQATAAAGADASTVAAAGASGGSIASAVATVSVQQGSSVLQRIGSSSSSSSLSLSPVSSGDLLSAAACHVPGDTTTAAAAAASPKRSVSPSSLKQQGQAAAAGFKGMLSRFSDTAAAAAGSAAASLASAMQGSSSSSSAAVDPSSSSSSSKGGLAGMPFSSSKAGMKLSLSWMQQQFAEGLALSSSSSNKVTNNSPKAAVTAAADKSDTASASPTAAAAPKEALVTSSRVDAGGSSHRWPRTLPQQLLVKKSLRLQSEPLTAVAATSDGMVFVAGHHGLLRVLEAPQLSTVRSIKLNQDLLCLSLLSSSSSASCTSPSTSTSTGALRSPSSVPASHSSSDVPLHLPRVLAGCQNGDVVAYAAAAGRQLGSWAAHRDAVSSMLQLGSGGARLATASWDCSVKVWDIAEGRQPWSSTVMLPTQEVSDLDSQVWAAAASASGQLLVTGTEEGTVAAWDLRTRQQIWATQVSNDYVGGVSLLPGGNYVAAAAADGTVSLLEWRRAGACIATAKCDSPLHCCTCDGVLMISGTENGQLLMWNLAQLTGQQEAADGNGSSFSLAGPDGLYPSVSCPSKASVNSVAVGVLSDNGGPGSCNVVAALDDGMLVLFNN